MLHMIRQGIRVGNRLLLRISKQKTILIYTKTELLKTNEYKLREVRRIYSERYGTFHCDCNCCCLRIHLPTLGTLIDTPHNAVYMRLSVSFFERSKFPLADNVESNGKRF
jgi:hypothetical protein